MPKRVAANVSLTTKLAAFVAAKVAFGQYDSAAGTALKAFVASLRLDLSAVQAALDLSWTTSLAEGQINRPKMLKRTMYGRAGFHLLRQRGPICRLNPGTTARKVREISKIR